MKKHIFALIFIIVLSLPALFPLSREGFFQSDDGEWMVIRFSSFHEELSNGQLPVRFLGRLNYGYGYPVANFLYPGFMYLAEPIHLVGFGFVDSVKILLGISMLCSSIFSYLWLSKIFPRIPSTIGALVYWYVPYHFYDLYRRGSVGEILALTIVPFILWQFERKSILWSSLGVALLLLSHNTLAVLFLPIIFAYALVNAIKKKDTRTLIYRYISILVFGLGLSAFFWLPALFELKYTIFSNTEVSNFKNYFSNFQLIGLSSFVVYAVSLVFIFKKKFKDKKATFFLIVGALSIFLSLPISHFLWNILPVSFIQFPFRLLSVVVVSASFLTAFCINNFKGSKAYVASFIFAVIFVFSVFPYARPTEYFDKPDSFYSTNEDTTTVQNEYMPKWVKEFPRERPKEIVETEGQIKDLIPKSSSISFVHSAEIEEKVIINKVYFPGWEVKIDGNRTHINYEKNGLIQFIIPKGEHKVEAKFGETKLRIFADAASVLSFLALGAFSIRKKFI